MNSNTYNPVSPQEIKIAEMENEEYLKKAFNKRTLKSYLLVILGSLIYAISVVWILEIGDFFSSGVTGTSQIIVRIPKLFNPENESLDWLLGILIGVINVPLIIIGWRGVSKRYAILTVISIIVQTLATTLLTNFTISPFITIFSENDISSGGIVEFIKNVNIFDVTDRTKKIAEFKQTIDGDAGTRLLLAILGGGLAGSGAALCLSAGGSTGGIDVISSYLQTKKGLSFTKYSTIIDGTIILISSVFSIKTVIFTLVRMYIYFKVIDSIYSSYKISRLEIITSKGDEMRNSLLKKFHHGVTIFDAYGGYTMSSRKVLVTYISAYEVHDYLRIIQMVDPGCFVIRSKVKIINGKYIQKTIL